MNDSSAMGGSLKYGRSMEALPGPSIIPDRVLRAMAAPMRDIYSAEMMEMSQRLFATLPKLANTNGETFIAISNGHGAWQMALCNTLSRGDKILVLESGRFAVIWGEMAALSGVEVEVLPGSDRGPIDAVAVEDRLAQDSGHEIKAVLCVQTDTATGVRNDIPSIRAAIDGANHPALFMVDCIASFGCEPFYMDDWGVDITVAACQKGLMVPPGLGFLWANDKALAAHETADLRIGYLDWQSRMNVKVHYEYYAGTPPVSHIYGLAEALTMIEEEGGIEAVWARHDALASAVWAAVEAWSTPGGIEPNIAQRQHRSTAVTAIRTGSIDATEVRRICEDRAGLVLGIGIGDLVTETFRIGHMGHLNSPMILGTLGTVEAALLSMGAPIGSSGVAAAAEALSKAL